MLATSPADLAGQMRPALAPGDEGHGTLRENRIGEVRAWPARPALAAAIPARYLSSSLAITSCWIWLVPS
jgi:hypothetical protein